MTHIVLVVNSLSSLLNSSLEASHRLQAAGFRTTFICPRNLVDRIADQGESVVGFDHDETYAELIAGDPRPSLSNPAAVLAWIRRRRRLRERSVDVDELLTAIGSLEPDLLLIHVEMHSAVIATEAIDVPRLLFTNFFSVFRAPDLPPLSMAMPTPDGTADRVRLAMAWWWVRAGSRYNRVRHRCSAAGLATLVGPMRYDTVDPLDLNRLADRCGVDLGPLTDRSQWLRPHTYRHLPLLSYNAEEMELPHRPARQLRYVGPMIRTERIEPEPAPNERAQLDAMKAERSHPDGSRPLIYCSLGTVWAADRAFLDRVLAVFEARPDWNLVLGMGGTLTAAELGSTGANVLVLEWAPQLEILANADCFVTHGGINSLCEAVHFGVPVVTYSTGFVDQNGNARRVEHHRLGVRGDKDTDTPSDIEAAVEQAMADPLIASAVAEMQRHFQRYQTSPDGTDQSALLAAVRERLDPGQGR